MARLHFVFIVSQQPQLFDSTSTRGSEMGSCDCTACTVFFFASWHRRRSLSFQHNFLAARKFRRAQGPKVGTCWVANKRFEISKFKYNFPRARTYELYRARSRLYRSQILQVNTRWKVLAEIYTMHSFAPFSNLNFLLKDRIKSLTILPNLLKCY